MSLTFFTLLWYTFNVCKQSFKSSLGAHIRPPEFGSTHRVCLALSQQLFSIFPSLLFVFSSFSSSSSSSLLSHSQSSVSPSSTYGSDEITGTMNHPTFKFQEAVPYHISRLAQFRPPEDLDKCKFSCTFPGIRSFPMHTVALLTH